MKFLVVDDSATMRRIITRALLSLKYKQEDVAEAENGADGLSLVDKGGIDFVITDWNMPVMNGLRMVEAIRAGRHNGLPILMITTNGTHQDVLEGIEAGVDNYLTKPMTAASLEDKIELMIQNPRKVRAT